MDPKLVPSPKKKQCNVCWKFFASNSSLQVHMRVHTKEKPYVCNLCGNTFTQKSSLNTHMVLHSGQKNFSCTYCDKRFALKIYKTTHEKTCKAKMYPADTAQRQFQQQVPRSTNNNIPHKVESRYPIPLVGTESILGENSTGNFATFSRHFQTQAPSMHISLMDLNNSQIIQYPVKSESERFPRHQRSVPTVKDFSHKIVTAPQTQKPFQCTLCGQSYSQKSSLKTHLILHTGIKNFQCDWCDKKFALKLYKTSHEKSCKKKHMPQIPVQIPASEGFDIHEVEQLIKVDDPAVSTNTECPFSY